MQLGLHETAEMILLTAVFHIGQRVHIDHFVLLAVERAVGELVHLERVVALFGQLVGEGLLAGNYMLVGQFRFGLTNKVVEGFEPVVHPFRSGRVVRPHAAARFIADFPDDIVVWVQLGDDAVGELNLALVDTLRVLTHVLVPGYAFRTVDIVGGIERVQGPDMLAVGIA